MGRQRSTCVVCGSVRERKFMKRCFHKSWVCKDTECTKDLEFKKAKNLVRGLNRLDERFSHMILFGVNRKELNDAN